MNVQLVAKRGCAPDALLGAVSEACAADVTWSGQFYRLQASMTISRIIDNAVFAVDLSRRWGRLVVCTPEFAAWWRAHEGEPAVCDRIFFKELETS